MPAVGFAVDARALAVKRKFLLSRRFVTVNLPGANALRAFCTVRDETAHILGRVSEKQSHLVRERSVCAQTAHQLGHTALGILGGVASRRENLLRHAVGKILPQPRGAVEIDQDALFQIPDGQNPHAARDENPIQPTQTFPQTADVLGRAGEQISGFQTLP